jgi:hypothetical protein
MKTVNLSATALVIIMLSGCSAAGSPTRKDDSPAGSAPPGTVSSEGSAAVPTTPPAGEPTPPTAPSPRTGDPPVPNPPATQGADPEYPRDLLGAPMTITGTVTTAGGCAVLDTGSRRWALLGEQTGRLRDGSRVTVRGRPGAVPAGCHADGALRIILVS